MSQKPTGLLTLMHTIYGDAGVAVAALLPAAVVCLAAAVWVSLSLSESGALAASVVGKPGMGVAKVDCMNGTPTAINSIRSTAATISPMVMSVLRRFIESPQVTNYLAQAALVPVQT